MTIFRQSISSTIWNIKYRYRRDEQPIDQSIDDTWRRVAKAIAKPEKVTERSHWEKAFYQALTDFRFLPGGRILAGAGTKHKVTLFNCFVMNIPEDSLPGIFQGLQEGALTLQQGGGVGYDFSVLRPAGDWVKKTGIHSSGPLSFMRIWDTTCGILLSTGARRGAMMGVMRCDHPDIEQFIAAKSDPREFRHFNLSVMVSDAFMQAVKDDAEWPLVFPMDTIAIASNSNWSNDLEQSSSAIASRRRRRGNPEQFEVIYQQWGDSLEPIPCKVYRRIKARDLWQQIIRSAYDYAEPGVLFSDTINRMNNLAYCETIHATNPCGEIPLPSYGACDLGAVNLTQFVIAPFTPQAQLNWSALEETVRVATRFLDNIVDVSQYPLRAQKQQAHATRRIGLGLSGLADTLVMLGLRYGAKDSLQVAQQIMQKIAYATWQTSIDLAKEKGTFPLYQREEYLQGAFVQTLPDELRRGIAAQGVRNSHHNTIAPAGTISLLANNISNGIEPIFRADYTRHVRAANGEMLTYQVQDYAHQLWLQTKQAGERAPAWIDANTLSPEAHLQMQAVMQPYIDNAISKTINIPKDFPFAKLADVYTQAYALGLKGCTIFRPNAITGSVLEETEATDSVDQCCQRD